MRQVKARKLSNFAFFIILAFAFPAYFVFANQDQEGRGFVAALSICGVSLLVWILRDLWADWRFWPLVLLVAMAHVVFVAFVPWGDRVEFGILATPVFVADIYGAAKLIMYLLGATDG
jgi:hypothetical protein